jgi:hypothetical protein
MQLSEIKAGLALVGLDPELVCTVVAVNLIAESAVQVFYKLPEGTFKERLLGIADDATIALATTQRPWAFDGDAAAFQLACEAKRIDLAFLFGPMMAVHTSNVDPLPHQRTAVYESMLPRQPLRFVLADDPGSGKTIMAGLYIRCHAGRRAPRAHRRARQPGRAVTRRTVRKVWPGISYLLIRPGRSGAVTPSMITITSSFGSIRWPATKTCKHRIWGEPSKMVQ